jgi:hypothetical protein
MLSAMGAIIPAFAFGFQVRNLGGRAFDPTRNQSMPGAAPLHERRDYRQQCGVQWDLPSLAVIWEWFGSSESRCALFL